MIQKCSFIQVMGVFFKEPMQINFIREIGKKIDLAPTSVRNNIKDLIKAELIIKKKSKPFDGFVANRDSQKFRDYKQIYNIYSLMELKEDIINKLGPRAIVLFGSYQKGEDIESSDVDLLIISKIRKEIDLKVFEKRINRRIHLTFMNNLENFDKEIKENAKNGWVIYGRLQ